MRKSEKYSKGKRTAGRAYDFATFYRAGKIVTSTLRLDEVLQLITEETVSIMGVDVCSLRLLDDEKENLVLKATYGHTEEYMRRKAVVKLEKSVTGKAAKSRKPVFVENVQKDPLYRYPSLARKEGLVSLLAVPLIRAGDVIGVIDIYTRKRHTFTRREIRLLSLFSDQAAVAIENAKLFENLERNYLNTIRALGSVIDAKDHYTRGHSESVMRYSTAIAGKMNLSPREKEIIHCAAFLHDIGKVGIDMRTLSKSGPLTMKEWKTIIKHPSVGADIVKQLGFLNDVVPAILHHHERYDGKGYPDALKKDEIPLAARILGVADAFDAMTSARPYRSYIYTRRKAINQLKECSGNQFDPEVVKAFLEILEEEKERKG